MNLKKKQIIYFLKEILSFCSMFFFNHILTLKWSSWKDQFKLWFAMANSLVDKIDLLFRIFSKKLQLKKPNDWIVIDKRVKKNRKDFFAEDTSRVKSLICFTFLFWHFQHSKQLKLAIVCVFTQVFKLELLWNA